MELTKNDFKVVTEALGVSPIYLGKEQEWNWMSTKQINFQVKRNNFLHVNMNRQQAALAVVIYNDAEHMLERKGRKKYIQLVTPKRYFCEWEIMTWLFLEEHPEFSAEKMRLYLK